MEKLFDKFSQLKIAVIGDLILDKYVWGEVFRVSPEAPVPVVRVQKKNERLGGAGNTAQVIKALGAGVTLFGRLGEDLGGRRFSNLLDDAEIELVKLPNQLHCSTTVKTRIMAGGQHIVRIDEERRDSVTVSELETTRQNLLSQLSGYDALLFSDYGKGVFSPENLKIWMELRTTLDCPLVVDPHIGHFTDYRGATLLTPNEQEFLSGMGVYSDEQVNLEELSRQAVEQLQLEALLITRGENGMNLVETNKPVVHLPAEAREVYDVTGAGDTVAGVVCLGEALGLDRQQSIRLANLAAGIAVGRMGTVVVTPEEIRQELKNGSS